METVAGVTVSPVEVAVRKISADCILHTTSEASTIEVGNLLVDCRTEGCGISAFASSLSFTVPSSGLFPVEAGLNQSRTIPAGYLKNCDTEISGEKLSRTEKWIAERRSDGSDFIMGSVRNLCNRKKKKMIEHLVTIQDDGTVEENVNQGTQVAPELFDLGLPDHIVDEVDRKFIKDIKPIPPLNIVMLIVGTRGDVQPFIGIGKRLQAKGNRVRLATHANFREFVTCNGLEFYPLGGDPKVLAGYMVKNKGFLPSGPSEISIQKKQLKAIMHSLLPACTEPDGESGLPFKADAIIANPPAYGNVHVAEYLQIPLHIFFTMPWTPTNEFPHPLARVKKQAGYRLSYLVVDSLMWWGMRGLINEFRMKKLNLHRITYFNTSQGSISQLPTGYIWSPHLVPKPRDWGPRVDVVGFCFLNLAAGYRPPDTLMEWLQAGEKPIYVGFGSLPVEDPGGMTEIIVQALQETNERGIIDKGWGGLGALSDIPDFIFLLENCPHDWLFPRCAAVVHHGGAGTTAAGLKAGCPTTIVPFFGDQPFWGEQVHAKGVGPPPIPIWQFSLERLKDAIKFMLDPEVKKRAKELAKKIEEEDGIGGAVDAFYRHWPKSLPQSASTKEPPSLFDYFIFYLEKLSCMSCCS
eukprot:c27121_g2_i2 orf=799-2703(-)